MIETRLLRYFVTVAETEHVGRAAERLGISQSPLSRQIRQLEDELGVTLFERANRQIRLTDEGKRLLGPARDLLTRVDLFERSAKLAEANTRLSIGFVTTALSSGILPRALRALRSRVLELELQLRHANTEAQLAALRAGEIDVAIVHRTANVRGLAMTRVLEQPFRIVASKHGPYAKKPLTPDVLGEAPWIAVRASEYVRERWLIACASHGFVPQIAVEVTDYASAIALVDCGVGIALMPASQRPGPPYEVAFRELPWLTMRSELWAVTKTQPSDLAGELLRELRA
ncbi:MAG: LysR family transcriptional regulator [Kofleriaceae bacterium]